MSLKLICAINIFLFKPDQSLICDGHLCLDGCFVNNINKINKDTYYVTFVGIKNLIQNNNKKNMNGWK